MERMNEYIKDRTEAFEILWQKVLLLNSKELDYFV
jgi:hypothetical protein